ncbi:MAG: YtxH domain-containing protein [Candidatus Eisenbacteria bacterium]|uniref:YtxH domain-containing protein n=1 Tax=Eiseniibacteriota bacterium TaxID=2212470 RepID=A0A538T9B6_UNCEI|nr:MAG: YtxH domain-containing protein [Candidatus Eisenbacteria bacterium]
MEVYPNINEDGRDATNIAPFVLGVVVGAGIALLLAPALGRDTRRRVGSTVRRWSDGARQAVKRTRDSLNELKKDARSAIDTGREEYLRSRMTQEDQGARTSHSPGP